VGIEQRESIKPLEELVKARGLGGGKVVIECDDSYSLVLIEPEHRLITSDNSNRPSRHGTLDRTIVWLIVEDLHPTPGTNEFCNFGQVHSHMRQLFPVTAEFLGENANQLVNDRFGENQGRNEDIRVEYDPHSLRKRSRSFSVMRPFCLAMRLQ